MSTPVFFALVFCAAAWRHNGGFLSYFLEEDFFFVFFLEGFFTVNLTFLVAFLYFEVAFAVIVMIQVPVPFTVT